MILLSSHVKTLQLHLLFLVSFIVLYDHIADKELHFILFGSIKLAYARHALLMCLYLAMEESSHVYVC